ncbi:MAG: acyltransferase [Planctomycetales bacterium]|nr:acyltransferase [Planctomycetales bacterium]
MRSHRWRTSGLQLDRGVQIECPGNLQLGENVTLFGGTHLVAGRSGQIAVGDHTHIGRNCVISGLGGITIGGGCSISSLVSIYSVSNHYHHDPQLPIVDNGVHYGPVQIGNDVWIGTGAAILPGVTIGDHAVVGAGAVVNRDVPPWMVVVGVPARILKDRRESQRPSSLLPASHDKATHRRSA